MQRFVHSEALALCLLLHCVVCRCADAAGEDVLADRIVRTAGIARGLCVHLDCGAGELTAALGNHHGLLVHGLEPDAGLAAQARTLIDESNVHGRVSIAVGDWARLPYADDLVNLVVAHDFGANAHNERRLREIIRILAPRGVALLGGWKNTGEMERTVEAIGTIGIDDVQVVDIDGPWLRIVKPRPDGVDDWTHFNHNAGGNRVSQDTLAGPPTRLRWIDGPTWNTEADGPGAALSVDGRLYYQFNEAPHSKTHHSFPAIYARDAYNGLLLWKRPATGFSSLCFVATSQHVYTILERKGNLVAIDPDTGENAVSYEAATYPDWAVYHRGDLFMSAGARYAKKLMCIDAGTGQVKWRSDMTVRPSGPLPNFVVDADVGYYLDWQAKKLGCVELATGQSRWKQDVSGLLTGSRWRYGLSSHAHKTLIVGEGMRGNGIHAFADADGKHLWSHQYPLVVSGRSQRHKGSTYDGGFFIDGLYWAHVGQPRDAKGRTRGALAWEGLDPATGTVRRRFEYPDDVSVGDSCHRAQATVNYFMGGHTRFVSTRTGEYVPRAYGIHNSCRFGMLPANGLTYTWSQYTNTYVRGVLGLTTARTKQPPNVDPAVRLEKGPAYGEVESVAEGKDDWPCFRRDAARSAGSSSRIPSMKPPLAWRAQLDDEVSPPVVSGGLVFVAQPDAYRIVALRRSDGQIAWKFPAGGRIACPPTIYQGLCLFGCADGSAYCLRARDGELAWRFRAARFDRLIVVRGRLESAWPVEGGIVVDGGLACFAAGRHGTLDGGVDVYALKPATGEVVWTRRETNTPVVSMLASDGSSVSLGGKSAFALDTGEPASRPPFSPAVYRADTIDLTQRMGTKNNDSRMQPRLSAQAVAIVRAGDVALVAGRAGDHPPALSWSKQRNSQLVSHTGGTRNGEEAGFGLWAFSIDDGRLLWEHELPAPPIFDGLAVADGNIYLTTADRQLLCFGAPAQSDSSKNGR